MFKSKKRQYRKGVRGCPLRTSAVRGEGCWSSVPAQMIKRKEKNMMSLF